MLQGPLSVVHAVDLVLVKLRQQKYSSWVQEKIGVWVSLTDLQQVSWVLLVTVIRHSALNSAALKANGLVK